MTEPTPKTLTLPAIPVREMVLLPGARVPFMVARSASVRTLELGIKLGDHLVLLGQRNPKEDQPKQESLHAIGALALVESLIEVADGHYRLGVLGVARVRLGRYLDDGDVVKAEVEVLAEPAAAGEAALREAFHGAVERFLARSPEAAGSFVLDPDMALGQAVDAAAAALLPDVRDKQAVLDQAEIEPRLHTFLKILETLAARSQADKAGEMDALVKEHKAFVLGEKMRGLPDGRKDEIAQLRERVLKAEMGDEAEAKALEELDRLEAMPPQSAEATVSRTYVDWLLALPWRKTADDRLDLDEAERILDEDHAGLEKVKARILEHLAVMRRLRDLGSGALRGPILCLVGPPGVGKTSLARSIARALNRPFLRFSLGGVRDESEIRGHRRTYIGSMPGRIISLLKKGGVRNPLILLDEIDKMGSDWRGDPSSALLEVLDPEQNAAFQDHYLDVGFDLSQVLFLATANVRHQIPLPLDDRLEIIELSSYTLGEKKAIATRHLVPRALERHGMGGLGVAFEEGALEDLIQAYTKEAGVRQLERELSAVLRKLARQTLQDGEGPFDPVVTRARLPELLGPERFLEKPLGPEPPPGVVNGLAWTPTGGDLLTIEAARLPGKGTLRLTGKLGEVMQESANLALSYVRMRAEALGLEPGFLETTDLHVHLPEGAIPKDGPSAGITLAMALISALTGIPARGDVAMTGELTLRGMVLPIGGLKEKLLAAHRMGCRSAIIPAGNARHLGELPAEVREQLEIHLVERMDEVLPLALSRMP
ncbi:endopeptidase La [Mesoterricola sediminis]|uniref:endopeptidase La n=1 Tax=Mesoterricola sediminis TaxID=2927980 RepID=A0AA48KB65_9BACT|nr:endopeptidase La [Mesoterricola sediminis]BDU75799.1 Lon protease [Mesoterricola sediminis]